MRKLHRGILLAAALLACLAVLPGCASIGPGRVVQDRSDYNNSLTDSWKRQILLNIVKIRYVEPMFFMDVGDIVAGYTLETGGSLGLGRTWFDNAPSGNDVVFSNSYRMDLGVTGKYTDRPTITYKPMTGAPFRRGIMSPMPVRNVMVGLESGISAQFLMNLGVRSMNGLLNAALSPQDNLPAQADFRRAVTILSQLQLHNALHVRPSKDGRMMISFSSRKPAPEVAALVAELQRLLDLDPTLQEYELTAEGGSQDRSRLAIQTYSLMQIMAMVASRVDVPQIDVVTKCALPGMSTAKVDGVLESTAVYSSTARPNAVYAAVDFHGHWFWVDDHDLATKRVFSFLMLAFTMMEEKSSSTPVQLTIPAQ